MNVDAAIRDEETFVLGGEDDEDIESHDPEMVMGTPSTVSVAPKEALSEAQDPTLYIVKPGDTLLGISMRLRVNGRELCRLNSLPSSTLTTTPHILHTRTTLVLPGHVPKPTTPNSIADASSTTSGSDLARARERAEKRLQTLTKEVDWRVAKAYVALADDPDEEALHVMKRKEMGSGNRDAAETHLEGTALDRYFDDDAWEAEEVRAGRGVAIRRMPLPLARKIKI